MSPEMLQKEMVDHRADIYSAGVVFHEMFTYRKAFDASQVAALVAGDGDVGTFFAYSDFPEVEAAGVKLLNSFSGFNEGWYINMHPEKDYNVFMAVSDDYLGESAHYRFVSESAHSYPHFAEYNSVYLNSWGLLSPTPVYLSPDSSSNGFIELSGLPDISIRLVLDAFRLEKVDRLDPPHAPTLKWVRLENPSTREIEIAWYPSLEGDIAGYRLFQSPDALTWDQPLVDETFLGASDHSYRFNFTDTLPTVYFRVIAVDTNKYINELGAEEPLLSEPSDAYGVGLKVSNSILIVDNFDRQASWALPYHPFVASHGEAVNTCGHGFDSFTETAVQNGDINLTIGQGSSRVCACAIAKYLNKQRLAAHLKIQLN